jgi:invasion protein IalB
MTASYSLRIASLLIACAVTLHVAPVLAQQAAPGGLPSGSPDSAGAAADEAGWATNCNAMSRSATLQCTVEQRVVVQETGQLISGVVVRLDAPDRDPVLVLQLAFGLKLSDGVRLQIDERAPLELVFETCDPRGCFAIAQASALVPAMTAGRNLHIIANSLDGSPVTFTHPLDGFGAAYESVR